MKLAENLKDEMKKRKLKVRDIAENAGVSRGIISEITKGNVINPGVITVGKIAKCLGISIDELVGDIE